MGSYRELFKTIEILPFLYTVSIFTLLYTVNNKHLFRKNWGVHNHNTRSANNFHQPITNLTKYLKGAYYAGIKVFNHLPTHISVYRMTCKFLNQPSRGFFFLTHFLLLRNIFILINNIYSRLLCFNVIINILLHNHYIIIVFCNLTAVI